MGVFTRRKSRATRRAEARAIKAKAKLEAKLAARNDARRIKADGRRQSAAIKAGLKAQRDSDKSALKVAETHLKAAKEGKLLSPSRIRRVLTVSRLLAPVVVPVVYRAAIAASSGSSRAPVALYPHALPAPSRRCGRSPSRSPRTPRPSSSPARSTTG